MVNRYKNNIGIEIKDKKVLITCVKRYKDYRLITDHYVTDLFKYDLDRQRDVDIKRSNIVCALSYSQILESIAEIADKNSSELEVLEKIKERADELFFTEKEQLYFDFYRIDDNHVTAVAAKKSSIEKILESVQQLNLTPSAIGVDLYAVLGILELGKKEEIFIFIDQDEYTYLVFYHRGFIAYIDVLYDYSAKNIEYAKKFIEKKYETTISKMLAIGKLRDDKSFMKNLGLRLARHTLRRDVELSGNVDKQLFYSNFYYNPLSIGLALR